MYSYSQPWRAVLRRLLLWIPVLVLLGTVIGGAGLYFFTGWRAGDLARKAVANARAGNLQMAALQIASARNLRAGNAEVRRATIYVRSMCNNSDAPARWEELAEEMTLTAGEAEERARAATFFGTDTQFATALAALEQGGDQAKAAALRSTRALSRGDLEQSIREATTAAGISGDPAQKLELVRLLLSRHAPLLRMPDPTPDEVRSGQRIIALVDELQGTPEARDAVALVLGAFPQTPGKMRAWADAAMADLSSGNPALLPAAGYLVRSGAAKAPDVYRKLSPAFAGAAPARQAGFARWLTGHGMAEEATVLLTPEKAATDPAAYEERGRALAALGRWNDLLALSETPATAPESMRLFFRGWSSRELGKIGVAPKALRDALRASAREGTTLQIVAALDSIGEGKTADPILIEMCGTSGMADRMFRAARDRFRRRGQFASIAKAWEAAAAAEPDARSVRDYRRRMELLAGRPVPSAETASAMDAAPADANAHFTHALALLREGRSADALGVFHDIDIFVDQLPPGDKAIVIAIWEANGMAGKAATLRRSVDPILLEKGEYALILR